MPLKFCVQIQMFNVEKYILHTIANCAPYVEKVYIGYSEFPWAYNKEARDIYKNETDPDILRSSPFFDKVVLIKGVWDADEAQRNACLQAAISDGMDYMVIQDADEFYTTEDFKQNLVEISENQGYDYYRTPWYCYWKSSDWVLEGRDGDLVVGYPEFAVSCRTGVRFTNKRSFSPDKNSFTLSGLCHHFSYVWDDLELKRKIETWSHAADFDTQRWYKRKWLSWHPGMKDLHPIDPPAWKRARRVTHALPEATLAIPMSVPTLRTPSIKDYIVEYGYKLEDFFKRTVAGKELPVGKLYRVGKKTLKSVGLPLASFGKEDMKKQLKQFLAKILGLSVPPNVSIAGHPTVASPPSVTNIDSEPDRRLLNLIVDALPLIPKIQFTWAERIEDPARNWLLTWPGEHYKLFGALLTVLKPKNIFEIGTYTGMSALAMKDFLPPDGRIVTYDVCSWDALTLAPSQRPLRADDFDERLSQKLLDLTQSSVQNLERPSWEEADLIFIDAAKDGKMEHVFIEFLDSITFKNPPIVVFDDIKFLCMLDVWNGIKHPKWDITSLGHWSGTGIVHWV